LAKKKMIIYIYLREKSQIKKRKASFPFAFPSFFRNFALAARSYCHSEEKRNEFLLFFTRFSVTLHRQY